jgi:hypothetical protein
LRQLRAQPRIGREQEQAFAHAGQDFAVFLVGGFDLGVGRAQPAQELEQDERKVQQRQHNAAGLHHAQRVGAVRGHGLPVRWSARSSGPAAQVVGRA